MSKDEEFDKLANGLLEMLASNMKVALDLRFGASLPSTEATPQAILDSLLDVRARADRVEKIYLDAVRTRGAFARNTAVARAVYDDSWAKSIADLGSSSVRKTEQFEGPKERYAKADLACISVKRALRKNEEVQAVADEYTDIIRVALRGLNDIIQDHRTWLRSIQFQSYLEK